MDDSQKTSKRPHLTNEERLPTMFKDTEKIIKLVKSGKSNFKTALANCKLRRQSYKVVYNLSSNVLKQYDYIQKIIEEIKLLDKEKFCRREIASILIYKILFGNGNLAGKSKPELTINKYKHDIMNAHKNLGFFIPQYVRVHTLVTTVDDVIKDLELLGFKKITYNESITEEEYMNLLKKIDTGYFIVDFHFKDMLAFAHNENLVHYRLNKKGLIFLQDKSSYIPVHVLNPEPGSLVLDACAAPGIKTIHIASIMKNNGELIACERDRTRFKTLQNTIRCGSVNICKLHCTDFTLINPFNPAYSFVKYILLDPTCSGSGIINRMDQVTDTEDSKTEGHFRKLPGFQIILLKHALKFPSVKRVVYSTCSTREKENEYVVYAALNAFNHSFKLVPAMPDWTERGKDRFEYGKLCLRGVPEKHLTNGFFVAVFERLNDEERKNVYEKSKILQNNAACNDKDEKNGYKFSSKKRKRENSRSKELKKKHGHNKIQQEIIADTEHKKKSMNMKQNKRYFLKFHQEKRYARNKKEQRKEEAR